MLMLPLTDSMRGSARLLKWTRKASILCFIPTPLAVAENRAVELSVEVQLKLAPRRVRSLQR